MKNKKDLEKNYKKMYFENGNSTQKIYPYYVRFENENQARIAISLLNKLGFEKVDVPNAKSFDLCVNLDLKRYSHPNIAYHFVGCKDYLNFEQFKALIADFLQENNNLY